MPAKKKNGRAAEFYLSDFLPYKLAVATDSVVRVFEAHYGHSYNLTIAEWRALAVIAEHGTLSPTTVGQLATMDKVKVSRATQSLVSKGLLRQSPDPSDGRGRLLRLTRKGTTIHSGMVPLAERLQAQLFLGFSRSDQLALDRLLQKIITRIEMNGWSPPG
jgi:DNA-binding MarR family transcriptional regulator